MSSLILSRPARSSGLLAALMCLPMLAFAHGGPGFARQPPPQSPLVGLPPTYIAPGSLPPTYIPPGSLPPWATPSTPPGAPVTNQFSIPSDPGLSQRNLMNEELRLRGWDQGRWRNDERDQRDDRRGRPDPHEHGRWNHPRENPYGR